MKKLKIITIMLVLLLICTVMVSCGNDSHDITFFLYDARDTYISEMMTKMIDMLPENVSAEVCDAGNSQAIQNQQIVEQADGDADLLVVNAVDRLACSAIVEKCSTVGKSVIFFNREPLEDAMRDRDAYYVGAAADSLGKKQADMVADLFGENFQGSRYDKNGDGVVQIIILKGEQGHQDAEKRTENCISQLKERGFFVDVLAVEIADWSRKNAFDAMRRLYIQFGDDIELLFANNDDMALGAIDCMLEQGIFTESSHGYSQPFIVVGVDGTAVGLQAIKSGLLYGTVLNDSKQQSDAVLILADYLLNNRDLNDFPYEITNEHYIYIDGEIITLKNLSDYDE